MGLIANVASEVNQINDEDEVCGVFHAAHRVTSETILAYLMAHRPDCMLAFRIFYPSPAIGSICGHLFAKSGLAVGEDCNGRLIGTAEPIVWTRLLLDHAEYLESHSVRLSPVRLTTIPKPQLATAIV